MFDKQPTKKQKKKKKKYVNAFICRLNDDQSTFFAAFNPFEISAKRAKVL